MHDINSQQLPIFCHVQLLFFVPGCAGSMDWHSLHCSTTSLTTSIVMFGFTFLTRYKVLSFPKWCILCRSFKSSPRQHTGAVSFFSCSQALFTLVSMSALIFCDRTNVAVILAQILWSSLQVPQVDVWSASWLPLLSWSFYLPTLLTWSLMPLLLNPF